MTKDTVLETDVYNGENGHAAKHNGVNAQVNFLTDEVAGRGTVLPDVVTGLVEDQALTTLSPQTVTLRHNFAAAADTAAGGIGGPSVGPGGSWTLTGAGVAGARILSGQFVSPGGVTYATKKLASVPTTVRVRNIWTGTSGPTVALIDQTVLDVNTMNGLHVQTSKTTIDAKLADGGVPVRVPEFSTGGALTLANDVEYETRVDINLTLNTFVVTVTRVSDGLVMGQQFAYDSELATLVGAAPLLFIEPGANVGYTLVEAYTPAAVEVTQHVRAPRGFTGVIGAIKRTLGLFSRVGINTGTPSTDLHVVGVGDTPVIIEGSNAATGVLARIASTVANVAGLELRANGLRGKLYKVNTTGELRLANTTSADVYVDAIEISSGTDPKVRMLRKLRPSAPSGAAGQTAVGFVACSGVPSNADGENNDWCISDNGHQYFKAAGAWSQKV